MSRQKPIIIPATKPPLDIEHSAATIFLHGFGDDAQIFADITQHFVKHEKLPYMRWVIPSALMDSDYSQSAWYKPSSFSALPSSWPELDDPEDEQGIIQSVQYIESLIDELVSEGVPLNRIVVGGFSQGCALALLLYLTSQKYAGKLAGIYALMGYLPLADRIPELRIQVGLPERVEDDTMVLFVRGGRDYMVPKRVSGMAVERLLSMGVKEKCLVPIEYEGVGHVLTGEVLRDLCSFLEKVVPPVKS